ncbi:hypothetical protein ACWEOW_11215 [Monashia sp. NPDC004114]
MAAKSKSETKKVGDTAEFPKAGFVTLPDGTVVTAYGTYTFRHIGVHVLDGVEVEVIE